MVLCKSSSVGLRSCPGGGARNDQHAASLPTCPAGLRRVEPRRVCHQWKRAPKDATWEVSAATFLSAPVANLQSLAAVLPRTDQSLLILDLGLNLDAPRLDALLERHGQSQHAMAMRRGEFLQIQELGDREGLFV